MTDDSVKYESLHDWLNLCDEYSYRNHNRSAITLLADEEKAENLLREAFLIDMEPQKAVDALMHHRVWELVGEFERTPHNDQGELICDFLNFPAGTRRETVWQWFVETHPTVKRIVALTNQPKQQNQNQGETA